MWLRWRRSHSIPFRRGLFVAHGLKTGEFSATSLARGAKAAGYAWIALELDDFDNLARWPSFRDRCHEQGLLAGPWFTEGGNIFMTPDDADFTIAEVESQADYDGVLTACAQLSELPPVRRAIVTTFSPMRDGQGVPIPERAAPIIEAGFHCLTECDMPVNLNASPPRMAFSAQQLGWPPERVQPVLYCYTGANGTFTPASYTEWTDDFPNHSFWLAETVLT